MPVLKPKFDPATKFDDIDLLHPAYKMQFRGVADALRHAFISKECRSDFRIFETYRTPMRQKWIFERFPGSTRAAPWSTPHNYGLAVDFVPVANGIWNWNADNDWEFLQTIARQHGLDAPMAWDPGHVQVPGWSSLVTLT